MQPECRLLLSTLAQMRFPRSIAAYAAIGFAILIVALLAYGVVSTNQKSGIDGAIERGERKKAPDKKLELLDGRGKRSLAYWRGKIIVVNFWASWCGPCREEAPMLERVWQRNRKRGAMMVGFNTLDVRSDALDFVREFKQTYPMLRDRDGERKRAWRLTGIPETFLVDREGRIAWAFRGQIRGPELQKALDRLLAEKAKT